MLDMCDDDDVDLRFNLRIVHLFSFTCHFFIKKISSKIAMCWFSLCVCVCVYVYASGVCVNPWETFLRCMLHVDLFVCLSVCFIECIFCTAMISRNISTLNIIIFKQLPTMIVMMMMMVECMHCQLVMRHLPMNWHVLRPTVIEFHVTMMTMMILWIEYVDYYLLSLYCCHCCYHRRRRHYFHRLVMSHRLGHHCYRNNKRNLWWNKKRKKY